MANNAALLAARKQLTYWEKECEAALRTRDERRIAQCERFIAQCRLVISALESAKSASL
jgi:hypothetical protein